MVDKPQDEPVAGRAGAHQGEPESGSRGEPTAPAPGEPVPAEPTLCEPTSEADRAGRDSSGESAAGEPTLREPAFGERLPGEPALGEPALGGPARGAAPGTPPDAADGAQDPWAFAEETSVLPPASAPPRWTARAGVPPRPASASVPATRVWVEPAPPDERRWWAPAALAVLALLLLAALGVGIWLIITSQQRLSPLSPPASPTVSPAASPTPSAAPSPSPRVSPSPSASAVDQVVIPSRILSMPAEDAQRLLGQLGLLSTVELRTDPSAAPGTVVQCSPAPGTAVRVGSTVQLVVAVAPSPEPSSPSSSPVPSSP